MARNAFYGRGTIEEHGPTRHFTGQLVTFRAAHFLMRALQRESRLIVIKQGWLPAE